MAQPTTAQTETNSKIVSEIAARLAAHVAAGTITTEQLIKINNLAAEPERLKNALRWL